MAHKDTLPTTTIQTADQVTTAQDRLLTLAATIAQADRDIEHLVEERGTALAAVEVGNSGAQSRADTLGSHLATTRDRRTDLASIQAALTAGIARYHTNVAAARAEAARVEMVELGREARQLERDYVEAMTTAGQAGRRLNLLAPKMAKLRHVIYLGSGEVDRTPQPIRPTYIHVAVLRDPIGAMSRWATSRWSSRPGRRSGGPPRLNVSTVGEDGRPTLGSQVTTAPDAHRLFAPFAPESTR